MNEAFAGWLLAVILERCTWTQYPCTTYYPQPSQIECEDRAAAFHFGGASTVVAFCIKGPPPLPDDVKALQKRVADLDAENDELRSRTCADVPEAPDPAPSCGQIEAELREGMHWLQACDARGDADCDGARTAADRALVEKWMSGQ